MRTAAFRLARADLTGRARQTGLTAFGVLAAASAPVVPLALRAGLDDPFQDAQRATRGSDVAVYGDFSAADVATLTALPGVVASDVRERVRTTSPLDGKAVEVGLERLPGPGAAV